MDNLKNAKNISSANVPEVLLFLRISCKDSEYLVDIARRYLTYLNILLITKLRVQCLDLLKNFLS